MQLDPHLFLMLALIVILGKTLADLACDHPNDRVIIQVVIGRSAKYLNANGSLLEIVLMTLKCFLDYIMQKIWGAAAVAEVRAALKPLQLPLDHIGRNFWLTQRFIQHRSFQEPGSCVETSSPFAV